MYLFVMLSFIGPVIYLAIRMILGTGAEGTAGYHSNADYVLMIVQCLLGVIVIHVPSLLEKRFQFVLPFGMYVMYLVFLYCAIFLGEVRSFYYLVPHWDDILHGMSSLMLGFFGLMVVTILNRDDHVVVQLSPFFVALFAFCFAVSIGALWEIYEFSFDGILGLNMQKFVTAQGDVLIGHEAIRDTMKDIIVDMCGAVTASTAGYFGLKMKKTWFIPKLLQETKEEKSR